MSIYGISTEFTESIRFVTTVHSIDLFSDRTPGGAGAVGLGGVGQPTARQCMAGHGWVGWGRIYV